MSAEEDTDRFAEYQGASDTYEPNIAGPLIGDKRPTTELAKEFQDADPYFRIKTENLAKSHPYWRKSKGDGNCGWRAIIFSYFEHLLHSPLSKTTSERARLVETNAILPLVTSEYMIEDFTEPTFDLFDKLPSWLDHPPAEREAKLVTTFNDEEVAGYILYHFRLLTSAHLTANPTLYAPFTPLPLPTYVKEMLVVGQEIDDVGNAALYDILLEPARLGLDILYLNRSEGERIDVQTRVPERGAEGTLRLLYRPGHYDIIYDASSAA